ncbi:hypothetical protein GCM10023168_19150 [Fodinibacter luteus]|uniref:Uncharacterized protein n=1 Tax=Fodinibacter luteus TaxID=552064 RepID=A0ABP8KEY1_9MICO
MPTLTVRIVWPPDLTRLPPDARARITVEDVSRADAPSRVVAETVVTELDLEDGPVVALDVDPVDPRADLIVRVHVTGGPRGGSEVERGDLVTTESYPVLTRGHGDSISVSPVLVGS